MKKIQISDFLQEYNSLLYTKNFKEQTWLIETNDELIIGISRSHEYNPYPGAKEVLFDHVGGTIVNFKDSIILYQFIDRRKKNTWREDLTAYLQSRGLNAEIDNNDVLVDGYKVAGFTYYYFRYGYRVYGMQISINADVDIIRQICTKPMKKIPKGLSEYGITREEILEALNIKEASNEETEETLLE